MVKLRVYVETSVISYLSSRPSRDLIVAGQQELTRSWWESAASRFTLCCSPLVHLEASRGDPKAAELRLSKLLGLEMLQISESAGKLASQLIAAGALPAQAQADALHVAICATAGVDLLVTWNCRHIANATMYAVIDRVCRDATFPPPHICTPIELWGD